MVTQIFNFGAYAVLRWEIINRIAKKISAKRYLEIGVQDGECFRSVLVPEKVGVDPNRGGATVIATSDDFFGSLPPSEKFDLIFVDGLHLREQALRDIRNGWRHLSPGGVIVVHDCSPPTERAGGRQQAGGPWCGDVWRAWMDARHELSERAWLGVIEADLGCGLIASPTGDLRPNPPPWNMETTNQADFGFFSKNRQQWLNSLPPSRLDWVASQLETK